MSWRHKLNQNGRDSVWLGFAGDKWRGHFFPLWQAQPWHTIAGGAPLSLQRRAGVLRHSPADNPDAAAKRCFISITREVPQSADRWPHRSGDSAPLRVGWL